jgi:hypothetical protein
VQVVEAVVQVGKVRTDKARYEAVKASKFSVKQTLTPLVLINQADNDAQTQNIEVSSWSRSLFSFLPPSPPLASLPLPALPLPASKATCGVVQGGPGGQGERDRYDDTCASCLCLSIEVSRASSDAICLTKRLQPPLSCKQSWPRPGQVLMQPRRPANLVGTAKS